MNVHIHKFQVGDRVKWMRNGEPVYASVLDVNYDSGKMNLKVDGWMGTCWEKVDHNFSVVTKY